MYAIQKCRYNSTGWSGRCLYVSAVFYLCVSESREKNHSQVKVSVARPCILAADVFILQQAMVLPVRLVLTFPYTLGQAALFLPLQCHPWGTQLVPKCWFSCSRCPGAGILLGGRGISNRGHVKAQWERGQAVTQGCLLGSEEPLLSPSVLALSVWQSAADAHFWGCCG